MTQRFDGRVAVVTGSGRGIGQSVAERLAADGAAVAVVDLDETAARAVADGGDIAVEGIQHVDIGQGQHLAGVVMIATTLSDIFGQKSDPEMAGKLKEIASLIRTANNDVRDVARALHPADVDANGLVSSLRNLVGCYAVPGRTRCVMYCHEAIPVHDNDVAMHLYRIVLEAVLNASRHAHAHHISVHLGVRQKDIMLSITDDGVGLPPDYEKSAGLGLKLMHHRASSIGATLSIASRPSGGTVIRCCLPPQT